MLYEMHSHTPLCKHAEGEPEEYAAVAHRRGLSGIVFTCHNPIPDGFSADVRMSANQFPEYVAMIARARSAWAGRVDVRLGIESDYLPGMEKYLERFHASAAFHHVLGSVHPHLGEYKREYFHGDVLEFQKTYFTHLATAAETGLFDTISHPDLVKNSFPNAWRLPPLLDHLRACLDRIAKTGVAMELNTSGLNKSIPEMNPGVQILQEIHSRGIPVVIGADAHKPARVADQFETAIDILAGVGFTSVSFFLDRKRQTVGIGEGRASLIGVGVSGAA